MEIKELMAVIVKLAEVVAVAVVVVVMLPSC